MPKEETGCGQAKSVKRSGPLYAHFAPWNVAAVCSCLFFRLLNYSVLPLHLLSRVLLQGFSFARSLVLLCSCSLVLWLLLSYSYTSSSYCNTLHRSSLYSSSSRRYCLHLRGSSSTPSSEVFFSSTSSSSSIVESAGDISLVLSSNLRVYSGSLSSKAPHFFTNTCLVRILVKSLVAAVISQVFQRPSQCVSIGCLSLVAPTTILIKLLCLLSLSVCWVCVCVGRCFLPLCVLLSCTTG